MRRLRIITLSALIVPGVVCLASRDASAQQAWQITTTPQSQAIFECHQYGDAVIELTLGLGIDEFERRFEAYMRAY